MNQARRMNRHGRPVDGDPYVRPGDTFRTTSGRVTTPFPKQKREVYRSRWLIDNAVAEAEARGDDFNWIQFSGIPVFKRGRIVDADREYMLEYLFGWQPPVLPTVIRPLEETIGSRPVARGYVEMRQQDLFSDAVA